MTSDPDSTSPVLLEMNNEITRITNEHKRQKWRQFVETLDHTTNHRKLWRIVKAIDGTSSPKAENEEITFDGSQVSSPKQITNYFNWQFTTSKLVLPPKASWIQRNWIHHCTLLTTPSHLVGFRRFGSYPLSSQSRNQARTALSALLIGLSRSPVKQIKLWRLSYFQPSTTTFFHPQTNTVSDPDTLPLLLCYNWRMISRQVSTKGNLHIVQSCVAVDLTAEFETDNHNVLLSKIVRSTLPEATCRWLSNYLRDRQSVTSCKGVKSKARMVHTGVPQGSKMSPTLSSWYATADRTNQADLLCGWHNRMGLRRQVTGTGAQDQRLPDRDVSFHTW